jgi:Dolichyl-phosphate-mannose-protein mannosyltransferase
VLSSFTHLWNPTGFPALYIDEDIYMRKALRALQGVPLENDISNPLYGWLFLAAVLGPIGYPNSLHPSADGNIHSIEMLYLVPRIFIGILGILDTFLIYKIGERRYNRNVAFIASILFAVMPASWLTRYILLENIQLPLLLSSIFFAIYINDSKSNTNHNNINRNVPIILLSGFFLGLAIFTKIPAFTMIPLVGFLIYKNNKNVKILGLWFIPVLLLPLISPVYASSFGKFNIWLDGILYQTQRESRPLFDLLGGQPNNSINLLLRIDPVLIMVGLAGLLFAAIKRDFLLLLWTIPFIIWLQFIGYVSFFHLIPLFPAFCIAGAKLIVDLSNKIRTKKHQQILPFAIISGIGIFGLTSTIMLITTSINSTHFEAAAIIAQHLPDTDNSIAHGNKVTVIMGQGNSRFFWIVTDVFHKDHYHITYRDPDSLLNQTRMVVFIADGTFNYWKKTDVDKKHVSQLLKIYNDSRKVVILNKNTDIYDLSKYPYTGMNIPSPGVGRVEIRTNAEGAILFQDLLKRVR